MKTKSNKHYPDSYSILLNTISGDVYVFAGWCGDFINGDSWKLSSGTVSIKEVSPAKKGNAYRDSQGYEFVQYSGSSYILSKEPWNHTVWVESVLEHFLKEYPALKAITIDEAINILKEKSC